MVVLRGGMKFTIIVPAFNEEACLAPTLDSIRAAAELLRARRAEDSYVIVVDNNSTDGTSTVARNKGATVVHEPSRASPEHATPERAMQRAMCSSSSMRT